HLLAHARSFPPGRSDFEIQDLRWSIAIWKDTSERGIEVTRWIRSGQENRAELIESYIDAFQHKRDELRKYRAGGYETILLIQSDDVALLAIGILYQSFLRARQHTETAHLKQVWVAHTHGRKDFSRIYCFEGPQDLRDKANPADFMAWSCSIN
ncbi:MAG TPA: hypothetical protein VGX03_00905, partial [Candidatus Binatia bacterium]|nr:hypothetical protein [Candidatus Binatia bacterium]